MNRKLIVNEQLCWPEITEINSKIIVDHLVTYFKKYPNLKRKKTLPKFMRKKKKEQENDNKKNSDLKQAEFSYENFLKDHIRIGINSITKCLEKESKNIMLVLVCRSCKPLNILTRHIQVMCSMSNIPSGCVHNLNENLSKIFNIKTVTAIAICKQARTKTSNDLLESYEKNLNQFLDELSTKVIPMLPSLKNPFTTNDISKPLLLIEDVNNELNNVSLNTEVNIELRNEKKIITSNEVEMNEHFGADFISVNREQDKIFTSFNDNNFILFSENDDAEQDDDNDEIEMNEQEDF